MTVTESYIDNGKAGRVHVIVYEPNDTPEAQQRRADAILDLCDRLMQSR